MSLGRSLLTLSLWFAFPVPMFALALLREVRAIPPRTPGEVSRSAGPVPAATHTPARVWTTPEAYLV